MLAYCLNYKPLTALLVSAALYIAANIAEDFILPEVNGKHIDIFGSTSILLGTALAIFFFCKLLGKPGKTVLLLLLPVLFNSTIELGLEFDDIYSEDIDIELRRFALFAPIVFFCCSEFRVHFRLIILLSSVAAYALLYWKKADLSVDIGSDEGLFGIYYYFEMELGYGVGSSFPISSALLCLMVIAASTRRAHNDQSRLIAFLAFNLLVGTSLIWLSNSVSSPYVTSSLYDASSEVGQYIKYAAVMICVGTIAKICPHRFILVGIVTSLSFLVIDLVSQASVEGHITQIDVLLPVAGVVVSYLSTRPTKQTQNRQHAQAIWSILDLPSLSRPLLGNPKNRPTSKRIFAQYLKVVKLYPNIIYRNLIDGRVNGLALKISEILYVAKGPSILSIALTGYYWYLNFELQEMDLFALSAFTSILIMLLTGIISALIAPSLFILSSLGAAVSVMDFRSISRSNILRSMNLYLAVDSLNLARFRKWTSYFAVILLFIWDINLLSESFETNHDSALDEDSILEHSIATYLVVMSSTIFLLFSFPAILLGTLYNTLLRIPILLGRQALGWGYIETFLRAMLHALSTLILGGLFAILVGGPKVMLDLFAFFVSIDGDAWFS